jgi:hypothetical protein
MPLSQAVAREHLHTRRIELNGYRRTDGLYDIEAHLTDVKSIPIDSPRRGHVDPGTPLHDMWVRLTLTDRMVIVAAEAVTDHGPYATCSQGAASYAQLEGLRIRPGFLKEALARMAGVAGCTHLREVLQQIATTAFQTMWSEREERHKARVESVTGHKSDSDGASRLLNTCIAYASDGEEVRHRWPHLYTGREASAKAAEASQLADAGSREG